MKSRIDMFRPSLAGLGLVFFLVGPATGVLLSQTSNEPRAMSQTIRARSTVVLVDAVVRDRNGRHVPGLTPDDFEILEDGVLHPVTYVEDVAEKVADEVVTSASSSVETEEGRRQTGEPRPGLLDLAGDSGANQALRASFTAVVFDRLTPAARELAWKSVRNYIPEAIDENAKVGVFAIDLSLHTLQYFTGDPDLVYTAVDQLGGRATSGFERTAATLDSALGTSVDLFNEARASAAPAAGEAPESPPVWQPNSVRFDRLERSYLGTATLGALQSMVEAMRALPGRKTILFFSEGIPLPPRAYSRLWSTIESARKSDVTLYTVDAAGFRIVSTGAGMAAGQIGGTFGTDLGDGAGSGPLMEMFEGREESLRSDPHYGLKQLAVKTGGFLVRDTNDLTAGLQQIEQDLHSFYLLAYTPRDPDFDGRYRQIEVRVKVPDLQVRYRQGYYAVDATFKEQLLEYEMPAVALLEREEAVRELPVRASVLNFPRPDDAGFVAILADLAAGALAYREDSDQRVSNFTIVGLVKDESGNLVRKVSQLYRLGRKNDDSDGGDSILFYRPLKLEPGRYEVEVAAFDAVSGRAGIERMTLDVPEADPSLPGLSSLVIVGDAEEIDSGEQAARTPFFYRDLLFYPNLGNRVSKSRSAEVTLYFSVSPAEQVPRQARVEVLHYDKRLGSSEVELPQPGEGNEIKYVASISMEDYAPGVYTLRVSVPAGDRIVSRSRRFILSQ